MAISVRWDPSPGHWILDVGESFSLEDVAQVLEKTDWHPPRRYLWDLRALQQGPDETPEIRRAARLVELTRERWEGGRTAILVSRELDFGLARMFSAFAQNLGVEYEVFRDPEAAAVFLAGPDAPRA